MKSFKNYYRVLSVDATADQTAIKAAFRRLALRHHPDRAKTGRAARRFHEIREAYDVLSDPQKRRRYDKVYRAQTALRPAAGEDPTAIAQARASSAGLGIALDVLGLKLRVSVDAAAKRRAARQPKRAPRKGPPRKPSR